MDTVKPKATDQVKHTCGGWKYKTHVLILRNWSESIYMYICLFFVLYICSSLRHTFSLNVVFDLAQMKSLDQPSNY
jgi:hypothetical protein